MSVTTEKKGETVSLKSNAVRVDFNVGTGRISFFDKQGKALFTEKDYGAQFTPFNDAGNPTFSVRQAFCWIRMRLSMVWDSSRLMI